MVKLVIGNIVVETERHIDKLIYLEFVLPKEKAVIQSKPVDLNDPVVLQQYMDDHLGKSRC